MTSIVSDAAKAPDSAAPASTSRYLIVDLQNLNLERAGDAVQSLRAAVKENQGTLKSTPDDLPRSIVLTKLGMNLIQLFQSNGSMDELNAAVDAFDDALKLTPKDHSNRASAFSNVSNALLVRYNQSNNADDLDKSILAARKAANGPADPQSQAMYWGGVGRTLNMRSEAHGGDIADLTAAIEAQNNAIRVAPSDDPNRSRYLYGLGSAYLGRFNATSSTEDWLMAVNAYEEAAEAASNDPTYLQQLVIALLARVKKAINDPDAEFNAAVKAVEDFGVTTMDDLHRAMLLNNLGQTLVSRFQRTDSIGDLNAALHANQKANECAPENDPMKPLYMTNLAGALHHRFESLGVLDDLNASIDLLEKAVLLFPETSPHKAAVLDNLGGALGRRSERTGEIKDINRAIEVLTSAVDHSANDFRRGYRLNNLGGILLQRFGTTESTDDLNAAVSAWTQAVDVIPKDDDDLPGILSSLGNGLRNQFELSQSMETLDAAIKAMGEAADLTPKNSPYRGPHLSNLGIAFYRRAEATKSLEDANDAVKTIEESLELTSVEYPERAIDLDALRAALIFRYDIGNAMDDLNNAIKVQQDAMKLTPEDHPKRAIHSENLGDALRVRFGVTRSSDDHDAAVTAYEASMRSNSSPPRARILAARKAAELLVEKDLERASGLLSTAVNLLPTTSLRTGTREDKQTILGRFNGLASDAAALVIRAGVTDGPPSSAQLYDALRLLELGRGVMASAYFETRSDITDLKSKYPELSEKFESLRSELDRSTEHFSASQAASMWGSQTNKRYEASKEFDATIALIRSKEGFERFLLGPSSSELQLLASNRPIIYINVSRFGADAFILTSDDIRHLHLDKLLIADVEKNAEAMVKMLEKFNVVSARRDNAVMRKILEWLWDAAIEPILEKLGFTGPPADEWPEVMWIPVGQLSLFPLHAAGYSSDNRMTVDRVISSYSPTVRALGHAREQTKTRAKMTQQTLMISMATTPSRADLPFAAQEISVIDKLLPPSLKRVIAQHPTKADISQQLGQYSVVHFACHGEVSSNPSESQLLLSDWQSNPFSVADMAAIELGQAQLAFLSACHGADMRDLRLLDESIHMAGACQLAGFPTVVGTLWQVQDQYSPTIGEQFYSGILTEEGTLDTLKAARALHFAVRRVREDSRGRARGGKVPDNPMSWAPYIHVGV
jgi:CHAT domain-containing protein